MAKATAPEVAPAPDAGQAPQAPREYIETMLDQLAELARDAGELKVASVLRMAALEISRL